MFKLHSQHQPSGDQPAAIQALTEGVKNLRKHQTLLGVTGSGKTFTMANLIANTQKTTLVLAHNKTLAAQLYTEFREFFPENSVHYFVSYFDYYQPEAYIASSDTYIEKDSAINEEIDRLRHGATESLLTRQDVIVVASVSCIYGIGSPSLYTAMSLVLKKHQGKWLAEDGAIKKLPSKDLPSIAPQHLTQSNFLISLLAMQYHRNDISFERGNFRVAGETVDLFPASGEHAYRFIFNFDELESITVIDPLTGAKTAELDYCHIFPATHFATPKSEIQRVIKEIRQEFDIRHKELLQQEKYLEAERLSQRTKYDLEMLEETGFVKGIENYSRYLDGRRPGEPPFTLIDFFPQDFLLIVDESHMTLPQVRGMYNGDRARKNTLVEYGFRLPSALDNRPLMFEEFSKKISQAIYVSATPAEYELEKSGAPVMQIIRPTGLLDPEVEVRPTDGQIDDLLSEVRTCIDNGQRVLITTLTKRMSEDLSDHLKDCNIKTAYIHSEIDTLERGDILRDLRSGVFDVLVGINLLREGLDLPEVSLVIILDADKEGFLRSESALIQVIGRAARHENGRVIMYADRMTDSMFNAISKTNQRRQIQNTYNQKHHITPHSVKKAITDGLRAVIPDKIQKRQKFNVNQLPVEEYQDLRKSLHSEMQIAANELDFERAAKLRDLIQEIDAKFKKS